jgi:hypothetical protein
MAPRGHLKSGLIRRNIGAAYRPPVRWKKSDYVCSTAGHLEDRRDPTLSPPVCGKMCDSRSWWRLSKDCTRLSTTCAQSRPSITHRWPPGVRVEEEISQGTPWSPAWSDGIVAAWQPPVRGVAALQGSGWAAATLEHGMHPRVACPRGHTGGPSHGVQRTTIGGVRTVTNCHLFARLRYSRLWSWGGS